MTPGKDKLLLKGCKKGNNIQILHRFCYDVSVQMIEIYNEQVRDLLVTDGSNKRYPFSCYLKIIEYIYN